MKENYTEQLPLARTDQLLVKEVDDEVLVYDLKTDKAHCLNKTAAQVWKNCDGRTSLANLKATLEKDSGTLIDAGVVWLALDQLKQYKLLAEAPSAPPAFAGMSRRQLVRTLGVAAITLPAIISIISPSPVEAASCNQPTGRDPGCPCTSNTQCTSGNCHGGAGNQKC